MEEIEKDLKKLPVMMQERLRARILHEISLAYHAGKVETDTYWYERWVENPPGPGVCFA